MYSTANCIEVSVRRKWEILTNESELCEMPPSVE